MTNPESKGKATRSRKEAEAARKQALKIPKDKRRARAAMRTREMDARIQTRKALYTLDEKFLPARDRGPVKKFVRQYTDSRLTLAEIFMPITFVSVVMTMAFPANSANSATVIGYFNLFFVFLMLALIVDIGSYAFLLRRALNKEFQKSELKGAMFYGISRSLTLRAMRLPKPIVKVGGAPREVKLPKSLRD
ncbi:MAG: hypothetical protein RL228_1080 [Actinomycetota bacterium]|jgi:hypothetical protein